MGWESVDIGHIHALGFDDVIFSVGVQVPKQLAVREAKKIDKCLPNLYLNDSQVYGHHKEKKNLILFHKCWQRRHWPLCRVLFNVYRLRDYRDITHEVKESAFWQFLELMQQNLQLPSTLVLNYGSWKPCEVTWQRPVWAQRCFQKVKYA